MPLPPLPANSTACVFIDYTSYGVAHTFGFRLGAGASSITAATKAASLAAVLANRMGSADSFTQARLRAAGGIVSLPIAFTPVTGAVSGSGIYWDDDPESTFISFVGRGTTTGRKTRWEFYTAVRSASWPPTNRYIPGFSAPVDTLRANFTNWVDTAASPGEQVVTIGGDIPQVYAYVNIAKNSYWQRRQR